jgi:hypothetical protein
VASDLSEGRLQDPSGPWHASHCHFFPVLPPLVPFLALLTVALDALHGCHRQLLHVAQDEGRTNYLIARGMLGGDIKQLLGVF